jgi:hypothetical protein
MEVYDLSIGITVVNPAIVGQMNDLCPLAKKPHKQD